MASVSRCFIGGGGNKPGMQKGFSIVELMVALAVGVLVLLGVGQAFVAIKNMFDATSRVADRQEVLSYFINVVSYEARSSSSVCAVLGGECVSSSGNLKMDFPTAFVHEGYCPGESDFLSAVEYEVFANDETGMRELRVLYECALDDPSSPRPSETVVAIDQSRSFSITVSGDSSCGGNQDCMSVEIELELDGDEISFYLTRRSALIGSI